MEAKKQNRTIPIIMMILLFGMISFVTNLAAPMGIVLKSQFGVPNSLGMLGNFANFIAYAVMGIPGGILLQKLGYKKTALIAIAIGFVGVLIQYLSGHAGSFTVYLLGAFISGFSMCLLNTVVNPMLNTLGGGGNKGNQLIQVGGSFNSIMATITPFLVGVLIGEATKARITDVYPVLYIAMGIFALAFFAMWLSTIPEPHTESSSESMKVLMKGTLQFRHFVLGAVAIFVYVGIEVGVPGIANLYMTTLTENQAQAVVNEYEKQQSDVAYLQTITNQDKQNKETEGYSQKVIEEDTYVNARNIIKGSNPPGLGMAAGVAGGIISIYWLLMLAGRLLGAALGSKISSRVMLGFTSTLGILLIILAIIWPEKATFSFGDTMFPTKFVFIALVGICTSIMWGGIFNLAVEGLGKYVATASGIFMVLVCGGGIIPTLQGWIADVTTYMASYWLIVACLAYLLFYALVGSKVTKRADAVAV